MNYNGITLYNECKIKQFKLINFAFICNDICEYCQSNRQKIRVLRA